MTAEQQLRVRLDQAQAASEKARNKETRCAEIVAVTALMSVDVLVPLRDRALKVDGDLKTAATLDVLLRDVARHREARDEAIETSTAAGEAYTAWTAARS